MFSVGAPFEKNLFNAVYVYVYIYGCAPRCRLISLTDFIRIRYLKRIQNRSSRSEYEHLSFENK
jgi:hypothetical protein